MSDPALVTYTIKELLQRLDERMGQLDQKLDLRLVQLDERITHIERVQSERQYLITEHNQMVADVDNLKAFRARFLPVAVILVLLGLLGFVMDLYFQFI